MLGSTQMKSLQYVKLQFTLGHAESNIFRPMEELAEDFALYEYAYNHIRMGLYL